MTRRSHQNPFPDRSRGLSALNGPDARDPFRPEGFDPRLGGPGRPRRRRGDFPLSDDAGFPGDDGPRGPRGGGPGGGPRGGGRGGHGFGHPGHGGPHGRGGRRGPGGRAARGDVRAAVLLLLSEQPMHGYQLIQEIEARSDGLWRPSPGAVYPALNLLADEGLVLLEKEGGRRLARLTEDGGTYVVEHADELGDPWKDVRRRGQSPHRELRAKVEAVAAAAVQVARTGTEEQALEAVRLLERTRRELYLVLAGPEASSGAAGASSEATAPSADADAGVDQDEDDRS